MSVDDCRLLFARTDLPAAAPDQTAGDWEGRLILLNRSATSVIARLTIATRGSADVVSGSIGAFPVATTTKLSFVDVSPSTVAPLNDTSATSRAIVASSARSTGASVATNASIVAMFGWIMPAPFAMPVTVIGAPSIVTRRDAPFGTVSVVMIVRAAAPHPASASANRHAGRAATMRSTGSGSMMTPVENGSTSCAAQATVPATAAQTVCASASPAAPVPALALPALTMSARIGERSARCWRQMLTGAAQKRFCVNTPATCVPGARLASSRSSRDQPLMRAGAVPRATPGTGSKSSGARGE